VTGLKCLNSTLASQHTHRCAQAEANQQDRSCRQRSQHTEVQLSCPDNALQAAGPCRLRQQGASGPTPYCYSACARPAASRMCKHVSHRLGFTGLLAAAGGSSAASALLPAQQPLLLPAPQHLVHPLSTLKSRRFRRAALGGSFRLHPLPPLRQRPRSPAAAHGDAWQGSVCAILTTAGEGHPENQPAAVDASTVSGEQLVSGDHQWDGSE